MPDPIPIPVQDEEATFAEHLTALRTAAGLSIAEAAAAADLDAAAWQQMEEGVMFPSTHWVRPMALALGIKPHKLF